ncbi:radical SAM/SPASM domain-containing protein [Bacteroides faecalis]|uniref:Radical SAM/SPASM domain-containing protein n=1 Tax=Bacteroides faecalis TaxID=2447885 RepID=A0A401LQ86_9BACE|nr:radical SAM protein [Bacteroides faecalis]GCB33674.1 radical SAM/SPASM domain-containing protein [Bacteroides faecalis]
MKLLLENNVSPFDLQLTDADNLKWSVWNDNIDVGENRLVIFNTFSRNAVLMETSEIKELDEPLLNILFKLGILVESKKEEKKEWEVRYSKDKEDLSYIDLTILLTLNCQMRCVYCFEGKKNTSTLTPSVMNDILLFLKKRIGACKKLRVTWFGGEPLLAYNRLKEMSIALMLFCNENNIQYLADITTNGVALNQQRCKELIYSLNVKRYIITVDGLDDIQEQRRPLLSRKAYFSILWHNLEILVEMGASVTVRMTIDKQNVSHIPALLDRIANSKLNKRVGLSFCRTIDYNFTPHDISGNLYSEAEFTEVEWDLIQYAHNLGLWKYKFPHAAPSGGCLRQGDIVIGVDGEIYKCLDTVGDIRWITGNIREQGDIPQVKPEWYESWNKWSPLKNDICKKCVLVPLCNGGCPHNALFTDKQHGTLSGCPDWKANYRKQIKSLVAEIYDNKTI